MPENPFTYGNPISNPERFIGRRREVEQVFSRLLNAEGESTSIVGERRIYRSRDDRKIAGVCGGLAKHLNINVHLLRWAFVLTGQVTAPLYLFMWIYLEEEPVEQPNIP